MLTPLELEALGISLRVSLLSVAGSLPFGIALAWLLARRRFPGHGLLDGIVHLPLILPPVVVGYLLLVLLGRRGFLGAWLNEALGITLVFTWQGAAIAAAVMAFPLMVQPIRLSFEAVDRGIEQAARTLGASPLDVFATVTIPLALPGIVAGAILGFARSLGEFGATITFVSNIPGETRTIPNAFYALTQTPGNEEAMTRLVIISIVIAFAALFAARLFARRMRRRAGTHADA